MGHRKLGILLVTVGTFSIPVAQWFIFWLLGRSGGAEVAGMFAIVLSISTPIFTLTNLGLRNGYITAQTRYGFGGYVVLRGFGSAAGALLVWAIASAAGVSAWFASVVICQKVADGFSDLLFARLQRERRLAVFGCLMIVNGLVTVTLAGVFASLGHGVDVILAATALGSVSALGVGSLVMWGFHRTGGASRRVVMARPSRRDVAAIAKASWPIGGAQVLGSLALNIPTWVVSASGDASDVGRFAGGAYILTASWLLGSALSASAVGEYRAQLGEQGARVFAHSVRRGTAVVTMASIVVAAGVIVFGRGLLEGIYGQGFYVSTLELSMISLAAALSPGAYLMNAGLLVLNRYRRQLVVLGIAVIGSVPFVFVAEASALSGVVLAGLAALVGSVLRYGLSAHELRVAVRGML